MGCRLRGAVAILATAAVVGVVQGSSAASVLAPGPSAVSLNAGPGASPLMGAPTVTANLPAQAHRRAPAITPADCPGGYLKGLRAGDPIACLTTDPARSTAKATPSTATSSTTTRAANATSSATTLVANALPSSPAVACDGDGTSGARVQGLYVLETGATDRSAALMGSLKLWAAGVDDTISRSAALNGGVRHVRFVTETDGSTCTAAITVVRVPAGSLATLTAEQNAVAAAGYNRTDRKYLMWTESAAYCGIATTYPDVRAGQDNYANTGYTGYARVDTPCWGQSAATNQGYSVEAHELLHTLGAVQAGAPHGTLNGHCTDQADLMCYSDAPGVSMMRVCPKVLGDLADCNGDDYFSTLPAAGSWLATHWNVASSRYLLGGGDGASFSGTAGTARAVVVVATPVIPGLPTTATVTPTLPAGDGHTTAWSTEGFGCALTPTGVDTASFICGAMNSTGLTQVSAAVTDTTTGSVTWASVIVGFLSTARAMTLTLSADGHGGPGALTACRYTPSAVTVHAADTTTGAAVYGVYVTVTDGAGATHIVSTDASGNATYSAALPAGSLRAATGTVPGYAPSDSAALTVTATCGPVTVTVVTSPAGVAPGDGVVVTGSVTGVGGAGLGGQVVTISYPGAGGPTTATRTSITDGTYLFSFLAATTGTVTVTVTPDPTTTYTPGTATATLTVTKIASRLTLYVPSSATAGAPLYVSGALGNLAWTTGVAGATISGTMSTPGQADVAWSAVTGSGGNFGATVGTPTNGPATITATTAGTTRYAGTSATSSPIDIVTPTTAPRQPTGVTAVAGDGSAVVTWVPPADSGGAGITSYMVTGSPGGGVSTAEGSATSAVVTGLTNGATYTFTVTATNDAGDSAPSSASNAVTPVAPVTAPGQPTAVTATAGNGSATVTWAPPVSNGGAAISSYTVTAAPGGQIATTTVATSASVTGLSNGTSYTFTVTATNTAGTSAESTPSAAVTPRTVPGAPTGVRAVPGGGLAVVSWTAPASDGGASITGYTVTASPGGQTTTTGARSVVVTGLTNGVSYTFTVTATNTAGTSGASAPSAAVIPSARAGFIGTTPKRVLDTRSGIGARAAKLGAGSTLTLTVPGLPAGTTAVALNVTATGPTAGSYLSVYPGGAARPVASSLNFGPGQTIPNLVLVPLGPGNTVTFYNAAGTVNVIADLTGYYTTGGGAGFIGTTPKRVLDTRSGIGARAAKLGAGSTLTLTVPGLPAGTTAVALNVTATGPTAGSYLSVYPGGAARPVASSLNFGPGQTIPNLVLVPLGPGNTVTFYNAAGTVNVIADLTGYYR
jgi:hypothetical protein